MQMCVFTFINFSTNLKEKCRHHIFFRGGGGNGRFCTAVFGKNLDLHLRGIGVCGYGYGRDPRQA